MAESKHTREGKRQFPSLMRVGRSLDPHPLQMDPFAMIDGTLSWDGQREQLEDVL